MEDGGGRLPAPSLPPASPTWRGSGAGGTYRGGCSARSAPAPHGSARLRSAGQRPSGSSEGERCDLLAAAGNCSLRPGSEGPAAAARARPATARPPRPAPVPSRPAPQAGAAPHGGAGLSAALLALPLRGRPSQREAGDVPAAERGACGGRPEVSGKALAGLRVVPRGPLEVWG